MHIEERKVEKLGARRLMEMAMGIQRNWKEILKKNKQKTPRLEAGGLKGDFKVSRLWDWKNGGDLHQNYDVGNADYINRDKWDW